MHYNNLNVIKSQVNILEENLVIKIHSITSFISHNKISENFTIPV